VARENAQAVPVRIDVAKGTDVGRLRDHNEDCADAFSPADPAQRANKGQLFIVADGMGGHRAGEVASTSAVQTISREYYDDSDGDTPNSLVRAIQRANALIHQQAQESSTQVGMGTTVVVAVVRGSDLYLANVGDSRAYLMRDGRVRRVTRDHSFVEEQIRAGILTREEARVHPQRNVITRALGSKPDVEVDTYSGKLMPGDSLLLCSDGLYEYVQDRDIEAVLKEYPPHEAVPRLVALANERGGSDNITALVVQAAASGEIGLSDEPLASAALSAESPRQRLSLPWMVGLSAGGLIVVVALVAGVLLLVPGRGDGEETVTPTWTPTAVATPTVPPPAPTSTLRSKTEASDSKAGATLRVRWGVIEPQDGAVLTLGPS
jgi:serine/threonine protein phosphatase PrpC